MKALCRLFIVLLLPAAVTGVSAEPLWGFDVLVFHFNEGVSTSLPGYADLDGFYGDGSDVFVSVVENRTSTNGDRLFVRRSTNDGESWSIQNSVTGGTNQLTSPGICRLTASNNLLAAIITTFSNGQAFIDTYRYTYGDLAYLGYSAADFSYPGAGEPVSCTMVMNGSTGEVWLLAVDDNDWLFLTRTSDGTSWTPSVPVAANAVRPAAAVSADGHVAVAWITPGSGTIHCAVADQTGNFEAAVPVTTGASSITSPAVGWEQGGNEELGILWHTSSAEIELMISQNGGASWNTPVQLGEGTYPSVDCRAGSSDMAVSFIDASGMIAVSTPKALADLTGNDFSVRGDFSASATRPPTVVIGESTQKLGMFYIAADDMDIWFDGEGLTGLAGQGPEVGLDVQVSPNPSAGLVTVTTLGGQGGVAYRVVTVDGRTVASGSSSSGAFPLDMSGMPSGIYTVIVHGNNGTASSRMVRF